MGVGRRRRCRARLASCTAQCLCVFDICERSATNWVPIRPARFYLLLIACLTSLGYAVSVNEHMGDRTEFVLPLSFKGVFYIDIYSFKQYISKLLYKTIFKMCSIVIVAYDLVGSFIANIRITHQLRSADNRAFAVVRHLNVIFVAVGSLSVLLWL